MNLSVQYISQGVNVSEHLSAIRQVLTAGGKWVQLRLKDLPKEEIRAAATEAHQICLDHHATLILNDHPDLVAELDLPGVHLGKTDMSPVLARERLGSKIIGGTANTLADCLQLVNNKVDYIGLGPLRFTTTKKNLSPVLGYEGYRQIVDQVRQAGFQNPIVAIGGITASDLQPLKETGVNGIAVSGWLSNTEIQSRIELAHNTFR